VPQRLFGGVVGKRQAGLGDRAQDRVPVVEEFAQNATQQRQAHAQRQQDDQPGQEGTHETPFPQLNPTFSHCPSAGARQGCARLTWPQE